MGCLFSKNLVVVQLSVLRGSDDRLFYYFLFFFIFFYLFYNRAFNLSVFRPTKNQSAKTGKGSRGVQTAFHSRHIFSTTQDALLHSRGRRQISKRKKKKMTAYIFCR